MAGGQKRILIAVDGSEQSYDAINYVACMLPSSENEIVLFHVASRVPETFWDLESDPSWSQKVQMVRGWEQQQHYRIEKFMSQARRTLANAGFADDSVKVMVQDRKEGIARDIAAEALRGYDAFVVGRRGLSTLQDLVLGGIATKLIGRLSDMSVWLAGGKPETRKVLVAVDPSEGAMLAVDHVGRMLNGSSHEITLVHVVRGISASMEGFEDIFPTDYRQRLIEEAENLIRPTFDDARKRLLAAGVPSEMIHTKLITGVPSRAGAVVEYARQGGYGTIVAGRRGLSQVEEFNMGRVSNKIVQMIRNRTIWIVG